MLILASTNRFTASSELLPVPSVSTKNSNPLIVTVADACPVIIPVVSEVNTTSQDPPVVPDAQVSLDTTLVAPLVSVNCTFTMVPSSAGLVISPTFFPASTVNV